MTLIGIPHFLADVSLKYLEDMEEIYSEKFLDTIFFDLNIKDTDSREVFSDFLKKTAVSYLTAKKINAGRLQPHQQKKIYQKSSASFSVARENFIELAKHNSTNSNFHNALKDLIRDSDNQSLKEMFSPYLNFGSDGTESYSIKILENFFDKLIEAADNAPNYIDQNDKANLDGEYILWWIHRIGMYWPNYTDVPFTLGEWFSYSELEVQKEGKKGFYNSRCIDVLTELLIKIDKHITRSDIETGMRKYVKRYKNQSLAEKFV